MKEINEDEEVYNTYLYAVKTLFISWRNILLIAISIIGSFLLISPIPEDSDAVSLLRIITALALYIFLFSNAYALRFFIWSYGSITSKYKPLITIFGMIVLLFILTTVLFGVSNYKSLGLTSDVLLEMTVSFFMELLFLFLIGFIILIMQHNEMERRRPHNERIAALFNRNKILTSEEIASLTFGIQKVCVNFLELILDVDIQEINRDTNSVKICVTRTHILGNYTNDIDAIYDPYFSITTDPQPESYDAGTMHYISYWEAEKGHLDLSILNSETENRIENGGWCLEAGKEIERKYAPVSIAPDKKHAFRMRYDYWLPLDEIYTVTAMRHWDQVSIAFKNCTNEAFVVETTIEKSSSNNGVTTAIVLKPQSSCIRPKEVNVPIDTAFKFDFTQKQESVRTAVA